MKLEVWARLKEHHGALIGRLPEVRRSEKKLPVVEAPVIENDDDAIYLPHPGPVKIDFRPTGHKLVAAGRRVPQGGAPGDTYSHYAWMKASTREDRGRLFMVADVSFSPY